MCTRRGGEGGRGGYRDLDAHACIRTYVPRYAYIYIYILQEFSPCIHLTPADYNSFTQVARARAHTHTHIHTHTQLFNTYLSDGPRP